MVRHVRPNFVIFETMLRQLQAARSEGRKLFALLIDPDKNNESSLKHSAQLAEQSGVNFLLVGSSLLIEKGIERCLDHLRSHCKLPIILFPGNTLQVTSNADAILFLSLISGRNPELLIGQHVIAAPFIRKSGIEAIPTGYLLIDSGAPTSASYMSQTLPIPHDKDDIAAATSMAGELLGMKLIYLDAGSGARIPVRSSMIQKVRSAIDLPIIVGGGIRTPEKVTELFHAGADMVVVGNSIEQSPELLLDLAGAARN